MFPAALKPVSSHYVVAACVLLEWQGGLVLCRKMSLLVKAIAPCPNCPEHLALRKADWISHPLFP